MESFGSPSDCAKGSHEETEFTVPSIHFPLRDQVLIFHTSPRLAFPLSQTHRPVPTYDLDPLSSINRSALQRQGILGIELMLLVVHGFKVNYNT